MMLAPLVLPVISPATAALWNLFYAASRSFSFRAAGREWRSEPEPSFPLPRCRGKVHLRLGEHEAVLFLENFLPACWEGANLDPRAVAALPREVAGMALELACRDAAEQAERLLGLPLSVTALDPEEDDPPPPETCLAFRLTRDDGVLARALIAANPLCLALLAQRFAEKAPAAPVDTAQLPLACRLVAAGPELTPAEAKDLEAGDILLLPGSMRDVEETGLPVLLFLTRTCGAPARIRGATLLLEGPMTHASLSQPGDPPGGNAGEEKRPDILAGAVAAENLPLALAFDLGGLELTVAQAAALAPGQVLSTGRDTSAPVVITVAGRAIGAGSLVDVAGRIGVRIETLTLRPAR
jgi:type III secretion system YscQ/HrcQ family protein